MNQEVFHRLRDIIYTRSGIVLKEEKRSLLENRIQKRLKVWDFQSATDYLEVIESDLEGEELVHLIDAISTNTTYFWREPLHFEVFSRLLEIYKNEGRSDLSIWCAASSTGQEPYTLAMEAHEHLSNSLVRFRLLATDVSTRVLEIAQSGEYREEEVSKLPPIKRQQYFQRLASRESSLNSVWRVIEPIKSLVLFKRLNLVTFPYPLKGPIDIIFCRNVMIYFDVKTRQKIISEFERLLTPGGYLFLSLSESLLGIEHTLEKFETSVYRKNS